MKQLSIFSMSNEASSLMISEQKQVQNQSNLSSRITASYQVYEDEVDLFKFSNDDDPEMWRDLYDEYEDFDVCSKKWCNI